VNRLTVLDISGNRELESLSCLRNNIAVLDISFNRWLSDLSCQQNPYTDIIVGWSVPPLLSGDLFVITSVIITLHVPSGSISAYSSAVVWRDFRFIVEVSLPTPPIPPVDPDPVDPLVPPIDPIDPDDPSSTVFIIPSSSIKLSLTSVLLSVSSP
jgi:hypothetical protein